jgi:hypothetical protein
MTTNPYESPTNPETGKLPQQKSELTNLAVRLLVLGGVLFLLVALLLPNYRGGAHESARRMTCANHLKQIAIALQSYESAYGCLPPAYTVDPNGKPLHRWRTLILPFIEQQHLYNQIDLSKPWDDLANRATYEARPRLYECPSNTAGNCHTTYLAVVAPGGCFKLSKSRKLADIKDNRDLTLVVIEVAEKHAVHWMSPHDATEELILNRASAGHLSHPKGSWAACVSGRMLFLTADTKPDVLRALSSIDGKDDAVAREAD